MITGLIEKFKRSYVVSILEDIGLFSKKRPLIDDEDPPSLIEPPLKRNRYFNEDRKFNVTKTGSMEFKRASDGSNEPPMSRRTPLSFSSVMSNPKADGVEYLGTSTRVPTPIPYKHLGRALADTTRRRDSSGDSSPLFSSFKFSPSLTSTINKPDSAICISKRRPIRSPVSRSRKIYDLAPSQSCIQKRTVEISRFSKKRNIFAAVASGFGKPWRTSGESVRLEDKERYRQLLQQYTSTNVACYNASKKSVSVFSSSSSSIIGGRPPGPGVAPQWGGAITRTRQDPVSTCKTRLRLERGEAFPAPSPPHLAVARLRRSLCEKPLPSAAIPVIDLEPRRPRVQDDDDDDDIFITKEIKPSKPTRNSLDDQFQKSLCYGDQWFKDIQEDYREKGRLMEEEAARGREAVRDCASGRRACVERSLEDTVERRMANLDIKFPVRVTEVDDEEEDEEEEPQPPLTNQMESVIQRAFKGGPLSQVLAEKFNIQITRRDIHTLAGLNWLNDEVINFYLNLLVERGQGKRHASVYAFNTFFYTKLLKTGYASVKRWTKKVNVFSYDLLLVPVHLGMHWCLAAVDFRAKTLRYYDSMLGDNQKCLSELRKYLRCEHEDKLNAPFDDSALHAHNVKDIPQQMNGSDCGMFSCKFAEYLSRGARISFAQEHMPYFRRRMVYEIVSRRLL